MSIDIMLVKSGNGSLIPATADDIETMKRLKTGKEYGCTLKQLRNGKHHRLMFSLLGFAYDNSERITAMYNGQEVGQSFDSFRNSLVIMTGHYTVDVLWNGTVRYKAQSLKYAECSQDLAERIYNDLLTVICEKVFAGNYTPEQLDEITQKLMRYAA